MIVAKHGFENTSMLESERLRLSRRLSEITMENIELGSIHDTAKHAKESYIFSKQYLKVKNGTIYCQMLKPYCGCI